MIFDQAMSIYEIMSSNINFNLSLRTYLTKNVSVFLFSKLVLKEKKWLFFLFISLWENTLLWKKSQRNNKTQSTTVQIYTFWSWKERLEKAVTNQNKSAVPLTNQEQNKNQAWMRHLTSGCFPRLARDVCDCRVLQVLIGWLCWLRLLWLAISSQGLRNNHK